MPIHRIRLEILRAIFFILFALWFILRHTQIDAAGSLAIVGIIVLLLQIYEYYHIEDTLQ